MRCPFPGMDPYIEDSALWPDFQGTLITSIRAVLQPVLEPRYVAFIRERKFDVEISRRITPVLPDDDVDVPIIFAIGTGEIRQPYIEIVATGGEKPITTIELLSPDNKARGPARESYIRGRAEHWKNGANVVEIDLVRSGEFTVDLGHNALRCLPPWHYLVVVSRQRPPRQRALPRIAIPLRRNVPDVRLDLQAAFSRSWQEGPYSAVISYQRPPTDMSDADARWCKKAISKTQRGRS